MICQFCRTRPASQRHHKFSQTRAHRQQYGRLIDELFNIVPACSDCHASHRNVPEWARWDEQTFRTKAEEAGYILPPPLKSYKRGLIA